MIPFARIDPRLRQGAARPASCASGTCTPTARFPAYEFDFGDVNPPVHAWACWRVYKMTGAARRARPRCSSARVFQKLLLNFTWWVNRKDVRRQATSSPAASSASTTSACSTARSRCPTGGHLEQADGTAWMAFYCATMLSMALELAARRPGLRGHRLQVLRALRRHRRRHEHASAARACGTRRTASTTTSCTSTASTMPLTDPLAGRPDPAVRGRGAGRRR